VNLPARIAELRRFDLLVSDSAPDQALQDWLAQQAILPYLLLSATKMH
jgi:DeoR family deoxyribose operon repressor